MSFLPHLPNVPVQAPAEFAIYILPAAAWCCASRAAVFASFTRVEEIRTHRILLLPAASYQLPRKDGRIANPALGRASANRFSCRSMLCILLLVCRRTKGHETSLYHHPWHSPAKDAILQRTKNSHAPYRCRKTSFPGPHFREAPPRAS